MSKCCSKCGCDSTPCNCVTNCPPDTSCVNQLSGRDENCRDRKLVAIPNSIATSKTGKSIKFADGSVDDPIYLNLQEILLAGGIAVIDKKGKLCQIIGKDGDVLVNNAGSWVATPFESRDQLIFKAELLSSSSIGKLAVFDCFANGKMALKILNLKNSFVYLDADGNVTGTDLCDSNPVTSFDAIFGCLDGSISTIVPEDGKLLIGKVSGDKTIWSLDSFAGSMVWRDVPYQIGMKSAGLVGNLGTGEPAATDVGQVTGSFDVTTISIPANAKYVYVFGRCEQTSEAFSMLIQTSITINGFVYCRTAHNLVTESVDRNTIAALPVKLTDNKFTFDLQANTTNAAHSACLASLYILGYSL